MVETQQLVWNAGLNRWEEQLISTLNSSPILNQSLYVSKTGSDDTGNGSYDSPYLTIGFALSVLTNAGPFIRYAVYISPGQYSEPWKIKPWTGIVGIAGATGIEPNGSMLVQITAPTDSLGFSSDWVYSPNADAWIIGLGFDNHQTFDGYGLDGYGGDGYGLPLANLSLDNCGFNNGMSLLGDELSDGYNAFAPAVSAPPVSPGGSDYALFFAMMPGDNAATVGVGVAVQFPQNGPTSGSTVRTGPSTFNLPGVGDYEVSWQVSVSEPGQLQLAIGGVGLPHTLVGRAAGTTQLVGNTIITTSVPNSILSLINPPGNSTALTITPIAGGASSVSATLTIKKL